MKWYIFLIPIFLLVTANVIWNAPLSQFNETLPVIVSIAEPGHIDVHTTKEPEKMFNFGTTFPGTKVQKTMNLTRGNQPPAKVHITVTGEVNEWITLSKIDFILDENTPVNVTISIPDNAEKRRYDGNITIHYIRTYGIEILNQTWPK